ncbi:methyl-accepting chemotaxis protein [Effusibacillus pohliae]|uniref:methyl-accepting chemotaxis protein n=1 Tax=Effusibacillus pohliae TaxID=232270 RepID=UPI000368574A|nr:methyl-accepting chemotaxis protein [Effusibacillus pohliae]
MKISFFYDYAKQIKNTFAARSSKPPNSRRTFSWKALEQLSLSKKLTGGFLVVAVLLAITSALSFYNLKKIQNGYSDLLDRRAVILVNSKDIQINAASQSSDLLTYVLTRDYTAMKNIQKENEKLDQLIKQTSELTQLEEHKRSLQIMADLNKRFKQMSDQIIQLMDTGEREKAMDLAREVVPLVTYMSTKADQVASSQQTLMNEGNTANQKMVNATIATGLVLSVLAFALSIVIGLVMSRMILKPMTVISRAAEQIAAGNLAAEDVMVGSQDEIGTLASTFNQMKRNLADLIRQVKSSSEQVAEAAERLTEGATHINQASEQIAHAIQQVAAGTDKQVRTVSETAQTFAGMSAGVGKISETARHVATAAMKTSEKAHEGNLAINKAVQQMNSINEKVTGLADAVKNLGKRSEQIGQIVETITGIASQTNLLALNAAIEAARAGEHGRGFSVVAAEVRKLAEQSSQSAKQIAQLIADIQADTRAAVESMETGTREVAIGIQVVHHAGVSFEQIEHSIREVADEMKHVLDAVQQMTALTAQASEAVHSIAAVAEAAASETQNVSAATEEQLASIEEMAASASALSDMADELSNLVKKFQI